LKPLPPALQSPLHATHFDQVEPDAVDHKISDQRSAISAQHSARILFG
jgi:hypothetical protein